MATHFVAAHTVDGEPVLKTEELDLLDAWATFEDVLDNSPSSIVVQLIDESGTVVAEDWGASD